MRPLVVAAAVVAAVGGTASAAPAAFTYDRELGTIARQSLWAAVHEDARIPRSRILRVHVRCYRTSETFERSFERRFRASARRVVAHYAGGGDVHLRDNTCTGVREFLRGRQTVFTAAAFAILLHESLHRQGIRNERVTTCYANEAVRWGALWHGFSDERAIRARNLAFDYTRLYSPRSYFMGRPTCLARTRKESWPARVEAQRP